MDAFEWRIDRSNARTASGTWSLEVFTEGDHDDGTAWAATSIGTGSADAFEVSLNAWSPSESFNTLRHLVASLGPERPTDESDFPEPGANSTAETDAPIGGFLKPLHLSKGC